MRRHEARQCLLEGAVDERRAAARWFASNAIADDRRYIDLALASDPDHWMSRALVDALDRATFRRLERPSNLREEPELDPAVAVADAYARGVRDTSYLMVHELRRFVGFAKLSAGAAVDGYEGSQVQADLERLSGLLDAIETLGDVSATGAMREFDLAEVLVEEVARTQEELAQHSERTRDELDLLIQCRGPQPMIVTGDARLIEIAFRAGLRNACEAVEIDAERPLGAIVVAWDSTDIDIWISILDNGSGVSSAVLDPFEFASSTKSSEEHFGAGLAVARRAIGSLGGVVSLSSTEPRGACFELRWPIGGPSGAYSAG